MNLYETIKVFLWKLIYAPYYRYNYVNEVAEGRIETTLNNGCYESQIIARI